MDSRLNLAVLETHEADFQRHAEASRTAHRWPDDGLPPRTRESRGAPVLHPAAVLGSLLTWR